MRHLRSVICLLILILLSTQASAQTSRVDQYEIVPFQGTWTPLDASTATVKNYIGGPNWGNYSIELPFDFPYDGILLPKGTVIGVGANGAISLQNDSIPDRQAIDDPTLPLLIAPFNGDIRQGSDVPANIADTVGLYQVSGGEPGSRSLTIEYPAFHLRGGGTGGGGQATIVTGMQVRLYETSGLIEFIYQNHGLDLPTNRPTVRVAIGLNGATTPTFVSKVYIKDTKVIPSTDLRFVPGSASSVSRELRSIAVFPNPAANFLNIKLTNGEQIKSVTASDALGQTHLLAVSGDRVDVTSLLSGAYCFRIVTNTGTHAEHITILH